MGLMAGKCFQNVSVWGFHRHSFSIWKYKCQMIWKYEWEVMSIFICLPRPLSSSFSPLCLGTHDFLILKMLTSYWLTCDVNFHCHSPAVTDTHTLKSVQKLTMLEDTSCGHGEYISLFFRSVNLLFYFIQTKQLGRLLKLLKLSWELSNSLKSEGKRWIIIKSVLSFTHTAYALWLVK